MDEINTDVRLSSSHAQGSKAVDAEQPPDERTTPAVLAEHVAFWKRKVAEASPAHMPVDRPRAAGRRWSRNKVSFELSTAQTRQLWALAQSQQVSPFVTLLGSWAVLLGRWGAQKEMVICVGGLASHRITSEGSGVSFESRLPLSIVLDEDVAADSMLRSLQRALDEAHSHCPVPFEMIARAVGQSDFSFGGTLVEFTDAPVTIQDTTDFELALRVHQDRGRLVGVVEYADELFDRTTVERMCECWKQLLHGFVKHRRRPVGQLGMLTGPERDAVLYRFNDTHTPYPSERLVHELFERQVRCTPEAVALEHECESVTYSELNCRANQVARYLTEVGIGPGHLAGICIERGIEMVVGLIGILKAGAAYVPLDPSYPAERLAFMLEDASPSVVLTLRRTSEALQGRAANVIELDRNLDEIGTQESGNLSAGDLDLSAGHRVYVIYTSGSTGRPKGTEMSHRSMVNLLEWHRRALSQSAPKRVLQFAPLSFDVAFQEIFSTLCVGGTLVLIDEWSRRDTRALLQFLSNKLIQRVFVPPLVLQGLSEICARTGRVVRGLEDVITAGEQLRISADVMRFFKKHPGCQLHNHYGPTETHVVTALTLTGDPMSWPSLPAIGRPIDNTQIYVLDRNLRPVPIGVVGEIFIGGASLADQYLNQPELTAGRFTADPFGRERSGRLYKTGDLGRWRDNGTLEYLGRNDDQVKIRGFRVELGEIEIQLASHDEVKEAVVVTLGESPEQRRVIAYVTLRETSMIGARDLRDYLRNRLPEFCVPSAFVTLDAMPVTPSGKLDRRRLPAPEPVSYGNRPFEPPSGEMEEALAGAWRHVLRVERVGRSDNFFELGGDSLMMARMMERLRQMGLEIDARSAFEAATLATSASRMRRMASSKLKMPPNMIPARCQAITPSMVTLVDLTVEHVERIVRSVPGGSANIQDIYPLAPLQEGLLFHHLLSERVSDAYVILTLLVVETRQRLEEFVSVLQTVVNRHDALRTAVLWEDLPKPLQVVYREAPVPVEEVELDGGIDSIDQIRDWMMSSGQKLDLRCAPLLRLRVTQDRRDGRWYALLQLHHIVGDNTASATIGSEVSALLQAGEIQLPEPQRYRQHVANLTALGNKQDTSDFFRRKLADVDEPSAPFGILDIHCESDRIEETRLVLDSALARRIRSEARRLQTSPAVLFHAAWAIVVSHTSSNDDVVFGSVLLGQLQSSLEAGRMLGMFINTLPLRIRLQQVSVTQLIDQTQRELAELLSYEQASLAVAKRCSGVADQLPLFTSLLNYRHAMEKPEVAWNGVSGIHTLDHRERTNYPLTVSIDDIDESFEATVQADERIDARRVAAYLETALRSLTSALEEQREVSALSISILPASERQQVISGFNSELRAYARDELINEIFEAQARRAPMAIAVVHEDERLSYAELNAKANKLARHLKARGVEPGKLVGICVERGVEMIVGALAVLKAGGAYVPLDPSYPAARLRYVLEDCVPSVLLTQARLNRMLPPTGAVVVKIDEEWTDIELHAATDLVELASAPSRRNRLAYVIYTSGSTGRPKGVMVDHTNVTRLFSATDHWFGFSDQDVWTLFHSFAFDFSVWEMWGALLYGGRLVVVSSMKARSPDEFYRLLTQERVTVLNQTPSAFAHLIDAQGRVADEQHCLRLVIFGGEALELRSLRPWIARNDEGRPRLVNMYGITETTVHVTYHPLTRADISTEGASVIGKPIPDLRIYLLDRHGQLVPVGVVGEIYVAGAGVARGYMNRPELTAERFRLDPFRQDGEARMYRSGDLGRWRADGTIEYLGRNDLQVKIRGYRIELGEIEAQLVRHESVKEVVVVAREDTEGDKRLVAYVLPNDAAKADGLASADLLRAYLTDTLPDHMVPSAFVTVDQFPLTANGKLDRRALPAPQQDAYARTCYEPPDGDTEEALASVWEEVLRVERISRGDSFFGLGGDSLLAMQMIVRISSTFSIDMKMSALFECPTLAQLAEHVDEIRQDRLMNLLTERDSGIDGLLESVASMSDSGVQAIMQQRRTGVRHD